MNTGHSAPDRSGPFERVVVLGAGAWGTTLALVATRAGRQVVLGTSNPETADVLTTNRHHPRSLPGIELPMAIDIRLTSALELTPNDLVILAIPAQHLRRFLESSGSLIGNSPVVSAIKGIEVTTLKTPLDILSERIPCDRLAALSGPNLALEVARGQPATTVMASSNPHLAVSAQQAMTSASFRVYTGGDVVGVEMGGALKNIIAIGAGIADGFDAGHNAKAAFMTRGIAEIARLGIACGAQPLTFAGLSGIGDLIATCGSTLSRNHTVGRSLAEGKSLDQILDEMTETAEGVETTRAAHRLARERGVECPIIDAMYRVLFEGLAPLEAARQLMSREPTSETIG